MSISFYNNNADSFFNDTVKVDLSDLYENFTPLLQPQAKILDAGCGAGRDSKYFIEQGFKVTAFDASAELANKASEYIGIKVMDNTFANFKSSTKFDAIWACASLLHVPSSELSASFVNLAQQLKTAGIFYCSFKYGTNDIERNGRYFTNADEARLAQFIENTGLEIKNSWVTGDARPNRQDEKWLNAILVKVK